MVTSSVLVVFFCLNVAGFISLSLGSPFDDSGRLGARNEAFYDEVKQLLSLNHDTHHVSLCALYYSYRKESWSERTICGDFNIFVLVF